MSDQLRTHVLKVNIHCDGCTKDVKKVLKIQGVAQVNIDIKEGEQDAKVTVVGLVDFDVLQKQLYKKLKKRAELWEE